MTNIKFLLIGTSLSLIPNLTFAQCVATQDCVTLGYTETSCNGGKGVKCPFGNKWACLPSKESICKEEGFTLACNETGQIGDGDSCNGLYKKCSCDSTYKYTCSGTGYSGGSGSVCGGKYTACTCASGYEWKSGECLPFTGAQGELYYCYGKVVGVRATGMSFYVAMSDLGYMIWSKANSQCSDYAFCGNIKGTLPTKNQLLSIYNNRSRINTLLSANGHSQLTTGGYCWSSTRYSSGRYDGVNLSNGGVGHFDDDFLCALPILTSW